MLVSGTPLLKLVDGWGETLWARDNDDDGLCDGGEEAREGSAVS